MRPYLVVVALSLVGVCADALLKLATQATSRSTTLWYVIASVVVYCSTIFGWFYVIKFLKLSTIGIWYAISTVLFLTLIGIFHFGEELTAREVVGLISAIAALILLTKFA